MFQEKCYRCFKVKKICYCREIVPIESDIEIVILMHPMEARKERSGTGRLASLCLKQSRIIVGVDFTFDKIVNEIITDPSLKSFVLYPGEKSFNLSLPENQFKIGEMKNDMQLIGKRPVLFLIDGTWPCARKMMKLSQNLHQLGRLCFTPSRPSQFLIKQQPHHHCLSTIEAIYFFLQEWRGDSPSEEKDPFGLLMEMFHKQVQFQISCANNPNLPHYRSQRGHFKDLAERKASKKWEKRNLFFNI